MVVGGVWVQVAKGLLALEGMGHPLKPQTAADFLGFGLGSLPIACLPVVVGWVVVARWKRRQAE